jgi:outer membrane protein assembly factor BamB
MRTTRGFNSFVCFVLALGTALGSFGGDGNWRGWRGPDGSGVDTSVACVTSWSMADSRNVLWKAAVPGMAHASPIVWNDRVYVSTAVKPGKVELKIGMYGAGDSADEKVSHDWRLLAFEKSTGKQVWDTLAYRGVPKLQRHTKASQCNSTPATDGTNIVAILGSEGLFCFDMVGSLRWKKDLGAMDAGKLYSAPALQWGFASSPLLREGMIVVQCDVVSEQFIAAYRVEDGKEIWRTARNEVGTWCSPVFESGGDRRQVIVNGYKQIGGYDFLTGKERWHLSDGGDNPIPTPVVGHGLVFLTSAHGKYRPLRAVRLDASGEISPPEISETNSAIAWVHARQGSYLPSPILVGDLLYSSSDNGVLTCLDARTGAMQYSERLNSGAASFSASPVSDGKRLFFSSEPGQVYVIPAGPKFSILATNSLEEICMASPAMSGGKLFFRTTEHLVCVGER